MNDLKNLFSLKGKVIVITGATGLLGKMHADAVACYGGTPILLDLSQKETENYAKQLNQKYKTNSMGFEIDITNEKSIESNAQLLINKFDKIDALVNNAANNPKIEDSRYKNFSRLENLTLKTWNQDIAVGLTGAFLCSKHYGYQISKNTNGGSIINISSDLAKIAPDQRLYAIEEIDDDKQDVKPLTYSVVKTGLIGLTRYLATYWASKNVRCNALCPGGVKNNQSENFIQRVNKKIPMGRMANYNEYQGTLLWMLSDASSYLNGEIISVDGGRTIW